MPSRGHTVRRGAVALGGTVLAVALLSACSSGLAARSSSGSTTLAPSTSAGPETTADTAPVVVTERPTTAPTPLSAGASVATDGPPLRTTDVVLSFVGWDSKTAAVEAGGYLSPVVESGGTCTLALTKGSRTVTAVVPALADATTTSCGDLAVPRAQLTAGEWSAVLRYASRTTSGSSDPTPVTVPQ